ncbi:hypothetical protein Tco_0626698 [Tanacetum coccineum]|uniref:Uncharacterized protein n=1 Tax=Tanacetum coccineum TaxID=301880 RepID=A0ABQ4WKA7_9ASTR
MVPTSRYAEFFKKNLISQEVSGRVNNLEEIQDEDTSPSEITSEIPMEKLNFRVDCYCNAGFETDIDDMKSQTGNVFVLNESAVDWKSSMDSTTAMSTT